MFYHRLVTVMYTYVLKVQEMYFVAFETGRAFEVRRCQKLWRTRVRRKKSIIAEPQPAT